MQMISAKEFNEMSLHFIVDEERIREIDETVLDLIKKVRSRGDRAIYEYTKQFDCVEVNHLKVTEEEFKNAEDRVSATFIEAIEVAKKIITVFHEQQV